MATTPPSRLNRKQRKELARRLQSADPGLDIVHPHAAGIDVGNRVHYVAVRPDRDPQPVRRFECFTADLHRLADWLQQCGVTTVALQSTGVLSGWTGMRIVRAMLAGERDPQALAALSHPGIHANRDTIANSLEGTWRVDLLFVLQQEVTTYDAYLQRIAECDQALEQHLHSMSDKVEDNRDLPLASAIAHRQAHTKRRRKAGSHTPQFDLGRELQRISGVDLTRIDGIDVSVAQTVISEVGLDMSRWQDEHHFASWLGLCPDNRITGGKVIRRGTRRVVNRAATALRIAATTLLRSQSYLGAQYRRFRSKLGAPKAITAMAHKLAVLVYRMLKWGHEYVDKGLQYYEERHREQQVQLLKKRAAKLGLQIVGPDPA
jgi:transposase